MVCCFAAISSTSIVAESSEEIDDGLILSHNFEIFLIP